MVNTDRRISVIEELKTRYKDNNQPCLLSRAAVLHPNDVLIFDENVKSEIKSGDVVAVIGDFDAVSIRQMLTVINENAIFVPLSKETEPLHTYFFDAAKVDVVVSQGDVRRIRDSHAAHPMLDSIRKKNHPGLVLFSSGTTGKPKAILHDFESFLQRFRTPRPTLRTLSFLLFDHIGGINTLFHTLYNKGTIIIPTSRQAKDIVQDIIDFDVELLPTSPTFLRMLLLSGTLDKVDFSSLKVITYGTERMDENCLKQLCAALPNVDFRQTFGMSELGIMRVKSVARDSLWMHVGGEGVELKIVDGILKIKTQNHMVGYLNAPSPFDAEGWYDTKDVVERDENGAIRVVGRLTEWINIGGEKVLPDVIEEAALEHPDVVFSKAKGVENPITGQHIELLCQLREGCVMKKSEMKNWLKARIPLVFIPQRIKFGEVKFNHRFKKM